MKKILLALCIVFSIQFTNAQKVTFGVKGGTNLAAFTENFDSAFDYKYKLGFQFGGFAIIQLADKLYLQPELLYSLQGTKYSLNTIAVVLPQTPNIMLKEVKNVNLNESTLILPIMLKYFVIENLAIEIGPQLDYFFLISGERIVFLRDGFGITRERKNTSDFNFGVNLGVGYDINENLGLGVRYNYGFNRLFRGELSAYDNGFKRRNSIFSLNLEYRFN